MNDRTSRRLQTRPFVRARDLIGLAAMIVALVLLLTMRAPWWLAIPFGTAYLGVTFVNGYWLGRRVEAQHELEDANRELRSAAGRAGLN